MASRTAARASSRCGWLVHHHCSWAFRYRASPSPSRYRSLSRHHFKLGTRELVTLSVTI
jgi:hypothetical protein